MTEENFIENARTKYKEIVSPVRCKCLQQDIYFNADGFNHLLYNGLGQPRTQAEIKHKTRLIRLIVPVIKTALESSYEKRLVRKSRKKKSPMVIAEFWGMSAQVGKKDISIRVIVKRVGNGQFYFWSVMTNK